MDLRIHCLSILFPQKFLNLQRVLGTRQEHHRIRHRTRCRCRKHSSHPHQHRKSNQSQEQVHFHACRNNVCKYHKEDLRTQHLCKVFHHPMHQAWYVIDRSQVGHLHWLRTKCHYHNRSNHPHRHILSSEFRHHGYGLHHHLLAQDLKCDLRHHPLHQDHGCGLHHHPPHQDHGCGLRLSGPHRHRRH